MKTTPLIIIIVLLILAFFFLPDILWSSPQYTGYMPMHTSPMFMMGGFLFVALLLLALFAWPQQDHVNQTRSLNILEERLARGEIDLETYHNLKKTLREKNNEK